MAQDTFIIEAGENSITVRFADNESAEALKGKLHEGEVTVSLSDYGGFEKVGELPWSLARDDRQTTAHPGDIMLYQGRNIVIFYGTNSWAYTPLGHADYPAEEIKQILSGNPCEVTLRLSELTEINQINASDDSYGIYNLNGVRNNMENTDINSLPKGIYIVNGKKHIIK